VRWQRLELLQIVAGHDDPPAGFDPLLSSIDFSFKVECPTDFDCAEPAPCPPVIGARPDIDYLAKDYQGFRRLMLDRLSLLVPGWTERSAADLGVVLVELLAYAGMTVAPRDAHPDVLERAGATIAPPGEDGIAELVERYLLEDAATI